MAPSPTNNVAVGFWVEFSEIVVNFDSAADLVISETGTVSHTGVAITGGPQAYAVSVTGVSGDGTLTLAVNDASDIQDGSENPLGSAVTSSLVAIDTTSPVITRLGAADVTVEVHSSYTDAGAVATDNYDASVTVTTSGSVNTAVLGNYTLTYGAVDASGNPAVGITRTVHVVDTTSPVITRSGAAEVTVEVHSSYTDAGATATDNYDASVTVTTLGSVNTALLGDYTLTYGAVDSSGNSTVGITRTVHVVDTTSPVITR